MITLYGYPKSRSIRAAWALEEAGETYEFVKVDLLKGEGRSPSFLSINPGGKVPAIVEDGFVLTESAAIVTYVGDRRPASQLTPPAGTPARAHYGQWCFFCIGELEQPLWTIAKHQSVLPQDWRVPAIIETAHKEFDAALNVLETGLADRPFILGETFTGADILIAHTLQWAQKVERLPADSPLLAYLKRCIARPALAQARAREDV